MALSMIGQQKDSYRRKECFYMLVALTTLYIFSRLALVGLLFGWLVLVVCFLVICLLNCLVFGCLFGCCLLFCLVFGCLLLGCCVVGYCLLDDWFGWLVS